MRLLVVAALVLFARTAGAQSIAVANESSLPRLDSTGKQVQKRTTNLSPEAVSYADCIADQQIALSMTLSGFEANGSLQVWASNNGQSCTEAVNRGGATQQCWVVDDKVTLATTTQANVSVRRLLSGVFPFTPAKPVASADACGQVDLANVSLQILYFTPGNLASAAVNHTIGITVDTVGPAAPTGLTALSGNHRIQVSFSNISGGSADGSVSGGLTELTGVNAYCDLARTTTVAVDAGCTTDDADATTCADASVTTNACTSTILDPAKVPDAANLCGSFSGSSGTAVSASTLDGKALENGVNYAIAVSATDKYGNVGPLSSVLCAIPEETTDFWENYKTEGGEAGCASSDGPPTGALGAVLGLAGLAIVRRRRGT